MLPVLSPSEQAALVSAVARGERAAFERIYALYFRPLSGYLMRQVRDAALVEELVDDTFVEAWRHASRFRGESKLSTWLFGIARHRALDALRARQPAHDDIDEQADLADVTPGPELQASRRQTAMALDAALAQLPPEQREALELVLHQGFSYEETAQLVQAPLNTVKTRVFHARRRLRDALAHMKPESVEST